MQTLSRHSKPNQRSHKLLVCQLSSLDNTYIHYAVNLEMFGAHLMLPLITETRQLATTIQQVFYAGVEFLYFSQSNGIHRNLICDHFLTCTCSSTDSACKTCHSPVTSILPNSGRAHSLPGFSLLVSVPCLVQAEPARFCLRDLYKRGHNYMYIHNMISVRHLW